MRRHSLADRAATPQTGAVEAFGTGTGAWRTLLRLAAWSPLAIVLSGCAVLSGAPADRLLPPAAFTADVLLIGEVHDNAAQHLLRLRWLDTLGAQRRVAIALEQLDAARQADLDRARAADDAATARATSAEDLPARARRLAEAAGFDFRGWDWQLYGPVIELALRRGLPLVAANLSRPESVAVVRGGAAAPEPAGWGAGERRALEEAIRDGHCGTLPESTIAPMAAAQRSRDARLADALAEARRRTGLPVVLLAGNGHVRRDLGVPRYLAERLPGERVFVIGMVESRDWPAAAFDHVELTAPAMRDDPCRALRSSAGSAPPPR